MERFSSASRVPSGRDRFRRMTADRRACLEAARDLYQDLAAASPTLCLMGEARGQAVDLSRLGPRVLKAVLDALGAPEPATIALGPLGEGLGDAIAAIGAATRAARIEAGTDDLAIGYPWIE